MTDYAQEFAWACEPGTFSNKFVSGSFGKAPDKRLAIAYQDLLAKWAYRPDPPDFDKFANAEAILRDESFMGDCEDFGSTLASLCQSLDLTCRLALGEVDHKGHAWLEVRISGLETDPNFIFRLESIFGNSTSMVTRQDGIWLQLSPEGTLEAYRVTHFIETSGELITLPAP
jgi:hypothetical protein